MTLKRTALILLCSAIMVFCVEELHAQGEPNHLVEQYRYEGEMVNPSDFYVYDDERAILIDLERPDCALSMVQWRANKVHQCYGVGQGPGELQPQGAKVMYRFTDGRLWLTDGSQPKIYSPRLEFVSNVRNQRGSYSRLIPVNDSTVVGTPFMGDDAFLHVFQLIDGNTLSRAPTRTLFLDDSSPLHPVKQNFMLNQGPYVSHDGEVFMGFNYSSYLVHVDHSGIRNITDRPAEIPFPEYGFRTGGGFEAPNSAEFPECTMGIATDKDYVYVLHHGETFDIGPVRQLVAMARGRIAAKIEEWELTDRIFIYEKNTGRFVRAIRLPVKARKIRATDHFLYVLTIEEGPATLIQYQKPERWES